MQDGEPWDSALIERNLLLTLKVVRQVGALWLLPAAFYYSGQSDIEDLLAMQHQVADAEHDISLCYRVQCYLAGARTDAFSHFAAESSPESCVQPARCVAGRLTAISLLFEDLQDKFRNVFCGWDRTPGSLGMDAVRAHYCDHCWANTETTLLNYYEGAWQDLPDILELPAWDVLETMRQAALHRSS
ncbi:hypothetical protein C8F01DRAFT_48268 [Mycena amicta]|nr:hypothetical protein C8F01DRAFT_48268 [Mycena amicta]